jgi:hypothetical protein
VLKGSLQRALSSPRHPLYFLAKHLLVAPESLTFSVLRRFAFSIASASNMLSVTVLRGPELRGATMPPSSISELSYPRTSARSGESHLSTPPLYLSSVTHHKMSTQLCDPLKGYESRLDGFFSLAHWHIFFQQTQRWGEFTLLSSRERHAATPFRDEADADPVLDEVPEQKSDGLICALPSHPSHLPTSHTL